VQGAADTAVRSNTQISGSGANVKWERVLSPTKRITASPDCDRISDIDLFSGNQIAGNNQNIVAFIQTFPDWNIEYGGFFY
jgi:hypothetical protein